MAENKYIIKIGVVENIEDKYDGERIKVRVLPEDRKLTTKELPYAFPLLPKMVHIKPKVGEAVMIFSSILGDESGQRYFIGPIIHQPQFMNYDSYLNGATTLLRGSTNLPSQAMSTVPEAIGAMPKNDEMAFLGRKDTDVILGDDEIKIRCGVHLTKNSGSGEFVFNRTNPTYIKLKHHNMPLYDDSTSSATIVSENINLISTASKDGFEVNNIEELITDEELNNILKNAHVLPYGDKLVELLKIFITAFKTHTHPYPGLPPVQDIYYTQLDEFNLDEILSKNIRIN